MKCLKIFLIIAIVVSFTQKSFSQDYPTHEVNVFIPFTEGSATDVIARTVGQYLSNQWGQRLAFKNRPGAGGTVGTGFVITLPPDGYTILITSSSHVVNPALYSTLPYDPQKDFIEIASLARQPMVLFAGPNAGVKSLSELIAAAKASPGQLKFASPGTGSAAHLAAENFRSAAGIDVVHVPLTGGPEAIAATVDGSASYSILPLAITLKGIRAGELIPLGVTSATRARELPDVPTIAEAGLAGFESSVWWGVWARADIPGDIESKLVKDFAAALSSPEVLEQLAKGGYEPMNMTQKEFSQFVKSEMESAARTVKAAGIQPK